jgi:hypothetical protein
MILLAGCDRMEDDRGEGSAELESDVIFSHDGESIEEVLCVELDHLSFSLYRCRYRDHTPSELGITGGEFDLAREVESCTDIRVITPSDEMDLFHSIDTLTAEEYRFRIMFGREKSLIIGETSGEESGGETDITILDEELVLLERELYLRRIIRDDTSELESGLLRDDETRWLSILEWEIHTEF